MVGNREDLSRSGWRQGLGLKKEGSEPALHWCLMQLWGERGKRPIFIVFLLGDRQCAQACKILIMTLGGRCHYSCFKHKNRGLEGLSGFR